MTNTGVHTTRKLLCGFANGKKPFNAIRNMRAALSAIIKPFSQEIEVYGHMTCASAESMSRCSVDSS